jgi:O-acetylhomoserine (thiol)-lyase
LFAETLGNPGLDVLNIPLIAEIAHAHDLPLMLDSTFTTPYLLRPFDHGADLVFHSATKFCAGMVLRLVAYWSMAAHRLAESV